MDWQPVTAALPKVEARISFMQWCQTNAISNFLFEDDVRIDVFSAEAVLQAVRLYSNRSQFWKVRLTMRHQNVCTLNIC